MELRGYRWSLMLVFWSLSLSWSQICGTSLLTPERIQQAIQNSLERDGGTPPSLLRPLSPQSSDTIGTQRSFWVYTNNSFVRRTLQLMRASIFANLWVDTNYLQTFDPWILDTIITYLSDKTPPSSRDPRKGILPLMHTFFGQPPYKDFPNHEVDFLIVPVGSSETMGFFLEHDQRDTVYSNRADILYINAQLMADSLQKYQNNRAGAERFLREELLEVFAHEYQHLIFFRYKKFTNSEYRRIRRFINEGLSRVAEQICGFPLTWDDVKAYYNALSNRHRRFLDWQDLTVDQLRNSYARATLFSMYYWEQLGDSVLKAVVQTPYQGYRALDSAFRRIGNRSLAQMLEQFAVALAIRDRSVDPRYGFRHSPLSGYHSDFYYKEDEQEQYSQLTLLNASFHIHEILVPSNYTRVLRFQRDSTNRSLTLYLCYRKIQGRDTNWKIERYTNGILKLLSIAEADRLFAVVVNTDTSMDFPAYIEYSAEIKFLESSAGRTALCHGLVAGTSAYPLIYQLHGTVRYGTVGSLTDDYTISVYLMPDRKTTVPVLLNGWQLDPLVYLWPPEQYPENRILKAEDIWSPPAGKPLAVFRELYHGYGNAANGGDSLCYSIWVNHNNTTTRLPTPCNQVDDWLIAGIDATATLWYWKTSGTFSDTLQLVAHSLLDPTNATVRYRWAPSGIAHPSLISDVLVSDSAIAWIAEIDQQLEQEQLSILVPGEPDSAFTIDIEPPTEMSPQFFDLLDLASPWVVYSTHRGQQLVAYNWRTGDEIRWNAQTLDGIATLWDAKILPDRRGIVWIYRYQPSPNDPTEVVWIVQMQTPDTTAILWQEFWSRPREAALLVDPTGIYWLLNDDLSDTELQWDSRAYYLQWNTKALYRQRSERYRFLGVGPTNLRRPRLPAVTLGNGQMLATVDTGGWADPLPPSTVVWFDLTKGDRLSSVRTSHIQALDCRIEPQPIPATGVARISLTIPSATPSVRIRAYNAVGRAVNIFHAPLPAGTHTILWKPSVRVPGLWIIEVQVERQGSTLLPCLIY